MGHPVLPNSGEALGLPFLIASVSIQLLGSWTQLEPGQWGLRSQLGHQGAGPKSTPLTEPGFERQARASFHLMANQPQVCRRLRTKTSLFLRQQWSPFPPAPLPPSATFLQWPPSQPQPFNHLSTPNPGLSGPSPVGKRLALASPHTEGPVCPRRLVLTHCSCTGSGFSQPPISFP